jgi:D-tyrosyl-tRNA(Tyr) deacylase
VIARTGRGLLVYLGIGQTDTIDHPARLAEKVINLRIFEDGQGMLNLSVRDVGGDVLVVPNFTLMADARKGRRPSFAPAAPQESAEPIYDKFLGAMGQLDGHVAGGAFGQHMTIRSVADGPVNLVVEFPPG